MPENKLQISRTLILLLSLFVMADLVQATLQYYHNPMDGDMVGLALPADYASGIFKDPLALNALKTGEPLGAAGRFTAQSTLHLFYHHVPQALQLFVTPINSIYLATALFFLVCHLLFIYFAARLVTGEQKLFNKKNIIIYAVASPLLAFYGYYEVQGLIDHAPTYTFYYIWPTLISLFIFLPMLELLLHPEAKGISLPGFIAGLTGAILMSQGGALAPILNIMWGGMILLALIIKMRLNNDYKSLSTTDKKRKFIYPLIILITLLIFSAYAYYLKKYNPEFITNDAIIPLQDRFGLLVKGLAWILTMRMGFTLLLFASSINLFILWLNAPEYWRRYRYFILALTTFSFIYLALLPFGGYREYRPMIIRYDTLIPVSICLMLVFLHSCWYLLNHLQQRQWHVFSVFTGMIVLLNVMADAGVLHKESCEKESLMIIAASTADTVRIDNQCNIISWQPVTNPYDANLINKMLQVWNITERDKIFLQKKEK